MNKWIKRFLILSQIGGGFTGLALGTQKILSQPTFSLSYPIYAFMMILALFTIFAGYQIIENKPTAIMASAICQGIQIPLFYTNIISYLFSPGLLGAIYFQKIQEEVKLGFEFQLGCRAELHLLQEMHFTVGINVTALLLFIYLCKLIKQNSNKSSEPT